MSHFMIILNTIYQYIKPFLDKKMSTFEEYGALNSQHGYGPCLSSKFCFQSILANELMELDQICTCTDLNQL